MKRKGALALGAIGMACLMSVILCKGNAATPENAPDPPAQPSTRPAAIYTQWPFDAKEAAQRQDETAKALGAPKDIALDLGNGVRLKLVLIPAGEFMMGSPRNEEGRETDEGPLHDVTITKPFYMGIYAVTQEQYAHVMGKNPSHFIGGSLPVETVTWRDAVEFCRALSKKTVKTISLPTEAQWEYACRAGTTTAFNMGDTISSDEANLDGLVVYGKSKHSDYLQRTTPVGSFKPNAFGLYDMHGNVCQWCGDWHDDEYYAESPDTDPQGPNNGIYRVLRGGGWFYNPSQCRSAFRYGIEPDCQKRKDDRDTALSDFGFRVVMDCAGEAATQLRYSPERVPSTMPASNPSSQPATGPAAQREAAKDLAHLAAIWRELGSPYEAQFEMEEMEMRSVRAARPRPGSPEYMKDAQAYSDRSVELKKKFDSAQDIMDRLLKSEQLSTAEAESLRTELRIMKRVRGLDERAKEKQPAQRPGETREEYIQREMRWQYESDRILRQDFTDQGRLDDRLEALEALANSKHVRPQVCEILFGSVWPDVQDLKNQIDAGHFAGTMEREHDHVVNLHKKVCELISKIEDQTRMGDDPVRQTGQWTRIAMSWRLSGPPVPHSSLKQELVELWFEQASQAPGQLANQGLLTKDEASVIRTYANYQIMAHHLLVIDDAWGLLHVLRQSPAGVSLHRLERTLPALSRVVHDDSARPEYLEILGRCAPELRDDCREVADADGLALTDSERKLASEILPEARGVLAEIEKAMKDDIVAKAHRLEDRAIAIDAQATDNELSPAGMAAKARSLEREIEEVKSQAGAHGDAALPPGVERACRAARDIAAQLINRSKAVSATRSANQDYDDLSDAWENLLSTDLNFKLRERARGYISEYDYESFAKSKRVIRNALIALDQIERTKHLVFNEMKAMRMAAIVTIQPRSESLVVEWSPILKNLAEVQAVNPNVCDLAVRAASVDLCRWGRPNNQENAPAFALLNEIVGNVPGGDTPLGKTPQWKQVLFAWRFGAAMEKFMNADDSKSYTNYKQFVQEALEYWYGHAMAAADELKTAGTLDSAESILLRREAIYRIERRHYLVNNPRQGTAAPADSTESILMRVTLDIPAYRRLLRTNKLRPEIRDLVIETFRNDCRAIGDPERLARLSESDWKEAIAVSVEAKEILAQIDHPAASQPASATRPGEPVDFDP